MGYLLLDFSPSPGNVEFPPFWVPFGPLLAGGWTAAVLNYALPTSVVAEFDTLDLFQIHVALIVFYFPFFHKFQDPEWWAGDALWYSLYQPFDTDVKELMGRKGQRSGNSPLLRVWVGLS